MEENKNIDGFFKLRLDAEGQSIEEWAVPSDDVWKAAKSRFTPPKKKKKRFLPFFLFGILGLAAVSLGLYLTSNPENELQMEQPITKNINANIGKTNTEVPSTELIAFIQNKEVRTKGSTQIASSTQTANTKTENSSSFTNNYQRINQVDYSRNDVQDNAYQISNANNNIKLENKISNSGNILPAIKSDKLSIYKKEKERKGTKTNSLTIETLSVVSLRTKNIDSVVSLQSNKKDISEVSFIQPIKHKFPTHEFGITTSRFLFNAFLSEEILESEEGDEVNINSSFHNMNLSYSRWLNKKWSLNTGLNYSNLDLGIDYFGKDTIPDDIKNFIKDEYGEIYNRANKINTSGVEIVLLDGKELNPGDIVDVGAILDLKIRALQIPIMLDYHFGFRKFEFMVGPGVSLDLLKVDQSEIDFEILKDNEIATEEILIPAFQEYIIDPSIYANASIRYHIHPNWNIGLSSRLSLLGLPFSYGEIGLYYRWYK